MDHIFSHALPSSFLDLVYVKFDCDALGSIVSIEGPQEGLGLAPLSHVSTLLGVAEYKSLLSKLKLSTAAHHKVDLEVNIEIQKGLIKWLHLRCGCNADFSHGELIIFDVTEQKRIQEEHHRSVHKLGFFFQYAPDAFLILTKGRITECNLALLQLFDATTIQDATYINPHDNVLIGYAPWDISPFYQPCGKTSVDLAQEYIAEAKAKGSVTFEWLHRTLNDLDFTAEVSLIVMPYEGEESIFVSLRNISTKKEQEMQLSKALATAEMANRAKSDFVSRMSHEIRTPLNGVLGFTELLMNTGLNHLQQQYVNSVHTAGQSLMGIINDILDLSKVESGLLELEETATDLIALCDRIVEIVRYNASLKEVDFFVNIDPQLPTLVYVDSKRLQQILLNLVNNAIKFTHRGFIELKIELADPTRVPGLASHQMMALRFSVIDTGIGLSDDQANKIFSPYIQANASIGRQYGGTGLGLSIAQMLAQRMGAQITIQSELGHGTTFSFDLNLEYEPGSALMDSPIEGIDRAIMLVKPSRSSDVLQKLVEGWGIKVHSSEALHYLKHDVQDINIAELHCNQGMPCSAVIVASCSELDMMSDLERVRKLSKSTLNFGQLAIVLLQEPTDLDCNAIKGCDFDLQYRLLSPIKWRDLKSTLLKISRNFQQSNFDRLIRAKEISKYTPAIMHRTQMNKEPRILIVEDVELNVKLLVAILNKLIPHAIIDVAYNGQEAIDMLEKSDLNSTLNYSLVLMDIQMPVLDGIEATVRIRSSSKNFATVPIAALTAGVVYSEKELALKAGVDFFLSKPIEIFQLEKVIEFCFP